MNLSGVLLSHESVFPAASEVRIETTVDEALARIGVEKQSLRWRDLHLGAGLEMRLPADRERSGLEYRTMETGSIATFKRWIGFEDDAIRDGSRIAAKVDLSGIETPESLRANPDTDAARSALDRLAAAWLFGDSSRVAPWREAIEARLAPFRAQLVVARSIVLDPGSVLRLDGMPVIAIVERMVLRGGALNVSPVSNITIGHLVKEIE